MLSKIEAPENVCGIVAFDVGDFVESFDVEHFVFCVEDSRFVGGRPDLSDNAFLDCSFV
jgi:hypothetical protein